jgi:hypothetical protein
VVRAHFDAADGELDCLAKSEVQANGSSKFYCHRFNKVRVPADSDLITGDTVRGSLELQGWAIRVYQLQTRDVRTL